MARLLFNLAVSATTLAIAALSALPAEAAGLTWTLNNVFFHDGSSASGSFDYDGSAFTNVNIKVEQGTEKYPIYIDRGSESFSDIWQFPAATYKDYGIQHHFTSPSNGYGLGIYEADYGICCRQIRLGFSTPLSKFAKVADYISGGTASVALSIHESIDYKWLGAAGVYYPERYGLSGATVSTTFPTRPKPVPEPSMILGSVVVGATMIVLRRKRTKSNQTEH